MASPWDRPHLNRPGADRRRGRLRERFGQFGQRRVPLVVGILVIGTAAILAILLVERARTPQHQSLTASTRLDAAARTTPFRNCDAARAAGAAPVRRGQPGYGPHLDRDNDGIGCEPYPR
jgi:hypothetical protein